tara:strand:+ start:482 stop:622 length:141 start_codon:yes stop_codon:yes gene_type:complete
MAKKIMGWNISVTWDDDQKEDVYDIPDYVAVVIDQFLNELEEENND